MNTLIRYCAYPVIAGGSFLLLTLLATQGIAYWPAFPLVAVAASLLVAILERIAPYDAQWNHDHGDTRTDLLHVVVGQALLQSSIAVLFVLRPLWLHDALWPLGWPLWAQILLAGAIMDFWLYTMHRASHVSAFLWRLHAVHHSPERLYWLNGSRRHPLSAIALAGPGLMTLALLGATPIAVGAWLSFISVHLAFQHANLDYTLGPLRRWMAVAEMHRWHHKREFEDAQVNYGEVFLIWDRLFGTLHHARQSPRAGEVGLRDETVPEGYARQLLWPFGTTRRRSRQEKPDDSVTPL